MCIERLRGSRHCDGKHMFFLEVYYCYWHCYRFTPELACWLSPRNSFDSHSNQVRIQFTFMLLLFFALKIEYFMLFSVVKTMYKKRNVCEHVLSFFSRLVAKPVRRQITSEWYCWMCARRVHFLSVFRWVFLRSSHWRSLHRPQLLHSVGIVDCVWIFGRIRENKNKNKPNTMRIS